MGVIERAAGHVWVKRLNPGHFGNTKADWTRWERQVLVARQLAKFSGRTPLNAIGGHVQLLEMGLHGPVSEAQRSALQRLERSQKHLLALVNDILNLKAKSSR